MAGTTALLALSCNLALLAGIVIFDIDLVNSKIQFYIIQKGMIAILLCALCMIAIVLQSVQNSKTI